MPYTPLSEQLTKDDACSILSLIALCHSESAPPLLCEILNKMDALLNVECHIYGSCRALESGFPASKEFSPMAAESWLEVITHRTKVSATTSSAHRSFRFAILPWKPDL